MVVHQRCRQVWATGKWRRVVCVKGNQTTRHSLPSLGWTAFARKGAACRGIQVTAPTEFASDRRSTNVPFGFQSNIVEVYSVGPRECEPFETQIQLAGKQGVFVEVKGLVDDGAMVAAMDTKVFNRMQETLEGIKPSSKRLRMANGTIVPSKA